MASRSNAFWGPPLGPRQPPRVPDLPESGATQPTHTHRLPRVVVVCLAGLISCLVLTLLAVALLAVYVFQDHQYVQGRGQYRDAEQARIESELRDLACGLLDTLPADAPSLDAARDKYQCGPGVPYDQLPPEVQQEMAPTERPLAPDLNRADRTRERPELGVDAPDATSAEPPSRMPG